MNSKSVLTAIALLAIAALAVVLFRNSEPEKPAKPPVPAVAAPAPAVPARQDTPVPESNEPELLSAERYSGGRPALTPPRQSELSSQERPPLADPLGARDTPPEAEPTVVLDILNAYRRVFGTFPAGENNSQFVNALLGSNRDMLPFIPLGHPRINATGELVDAWGTPFVFHQNSRQAVEVRSAGPDRRLYTDDDIVAGKPLPPPENPAEAAERAEP